MNDQKREQLIQKIEQLLETSIAVSTASDFSKEQIISALPKMSAEQLNYLLSTLEAEDKKNNETFAQIIEKKPEFPSTLKFEMKENKAHVVKEVETNERKEEEATDILKNL